MNIKLNIDTQISNLNKLQNIINKYDNSSIDIYIDNLELETLIINYVKDLIDVDLKRLGFNLDIVIDNTVHDIKINYSPEDKNEYKLLEKELKLTLGNQILKNDKLNSRILLRSMFRNSDYYEVENSRLKLVYNNNSYYELKNKIQIRV